MSAVNGGAAEGVRRNTEIEDPTNFYFVHPIALRLTHAFAALGLTPNAVSLTGMLLGVLAGVAYFHYTSSLCAVAGFALMLGWHVMDGADGQLARLTNAQSESGKIIDGICDYVTFIAVYVALALALAPRMGEAAWLLVTVAGLCHALQAAAYEVQRQEYLAWGYDRSRAGLPDLQALRREIGRGSRAGLPLRLLYLAYVGMQYRVAGLSPVLRQRLRPAMAGDSARAEHLRRRFRRRFAPAVRRWAILSANYRTLGIFLCALLKVPALYFAFEIVGFTAILLLLTRRQHARYVAFLQELETASAD